MRRFLVGLALIAGSWFVAPASAGATDAPQAYRFGPGDQIRITVFGEPELSLTVRVGAAGTISYPFLGDVQVAGRTPGEVETLIAGGLRGDYLVDPKVNVAVEEYRHVYVNGAVEEPSSFPYVPGLTVRKAISMAGGMTERAADDKIFVIRDGDASGTPMRVGLDAPVSPGDIITVKESFF